MLKLSAGILSVALSSAMGWAQNQPAAEYLSDAQIAQLFQEINEADIQGAQLAQKKTKSNQIKAMAQQLERDHKNLDQAGKNMIKRTNIHPVESDGSKAFRQNSKAELEKLKSMKSEDFDSAYLAREVMFHQRSRDLVDRSLLPNVKDPGWKELLIKEKTVLEEHLQHAITVQKMPHK